MKLTLPPEPYLPGMTARPPDHAYDAWKVGLVPDMTGPALAASTAYRAGHDAFGQRYYWEAHEMWEAVWMCCMADSAERHVVQGLIQLANAGLKGRMGRDRARGRILALADAALAAGLAKGGVLGLNLDTGSLASMRAQVAQQERYMQNNA